jgi:molybdopterin biosynthesis enzyme MoaB
MMRAEVVVASNRAAAGVYEDTTGPVIVDLLRELGFTVDAPVVVPDGPPVGAAITAAYGVAQGVPSAVLSRGLAGVIGSCLVVNLPGSRGGVKDGLAVLRPVLVHAVEQVAGGDH